MTNLERKFEFASSDNDRKSSEDSGWKVLTVEDDAAYQASLVFALRSMKVQRKMISLLTARSTTEATRIISRNPDIAVILLDVVMEHDESGLTLVKTIRELFDNSDVRIILLTGQPGMAPQKDVMSRYDIDDYWCKSELTNDHLLTIITSNIRTWNYLTEIRKSTTGLQQVISASRQLNGTRDVNEYLQTILTQVGNIFNIDSSLICAIDEGSQNIRNASVMVVTGKFENIKNKNLGQIEHDLLLKACKQVLNSKHHIFIPGYSILYIRYNVELAEYIVILKNEKPLSKLDIHLLQIFFENVSVGLDNISLYGQLLRVAYEDSLLKMPNRSWLAKEIARLNVNQPYQAELFVVDVDDFAEISMTFGNVFCDQLMKCVSEKLLSNVPGSASIARVGISAIGVLVDSVSHVDGAFFDKLFSSPLTIAGTEHAVSITVSKINMVETKGYFSSEQIIRRAESLVGLSRLKGVHYIENNADLEKQVVYRHSMLDELRKAFLQKQFFILLQPKVGLADGRLVGFESLVRWRKTDGSVVAPGDFIPLAEASGLIGKLDNQVLRLTCEAVKYLNANDIYVPVSFNACSSELMNSSYLTNLTQIIREYDVDPKYLELEVTESQAAPEYQRISSSLEEIMALGMDVSIDDFGTGYSSLAHITDLKATTLKIDRTFVTRLNTSREHNYVIDMILELGNQLGFKVIAEGIETEEQRQQLLQKGCQYGQGYLFAKPLTLDDAILFS
ncbi:bifunctional diguanylate cyclase/phosphodiesterase [Gynuella sp.]|uniref:bifunctional diguanylate cyclase/phosphodiesterase n=1 Tax=Gynuella sp. TaxID=2969146 RepID=UPI003D12307C